MSETLDLKKTVNLPKTDFAQKANLAQSEPARLKKWKEMGLYEQIAEARKGRSFLRTGMKLIRERPDVRSAIFSTGLASGAMTMLQKIVPARAFASLRKKLKGGAAPGIPAVEFPSPARLPLQLPPPHFLEMAAQSFRFSSEKARRDLGYAPRYSLDAAFESIGAWARWSRLVS